MDDLNLEKDTRSIGAVVIQTLLLLFYVTLSIIGNSLVCLALYRNPRLRTVTNMYVLALAIADLLTAIIDKPLAITASVSHGWPFGFELCQLNGVMVHFWASASVSTITITAVNRYVCITKPQQYRAYFTKKNTCIRIIVIWVIAFLFVVTVTFVSPITYKYRPSSFYCVPTYLSRGVERSTGIIFLGIFFFIPSGIVIFCYWKVFCEVRHHNATVIPSLRQRGNVNLTVSIDEIHATKILFVTAVAFSLSWMPLNIIVFVRSILLMPIPAFASSIYSFMASASIFINPIIYGVMNRSLRREFAAILHCGRN